MKRRDFIVLGTAAGLAGGRHIPHLRPKLFPPCDRLDADPTGARRLPRRQNAWQPPVFSHRYRWRVEN